MRYGIRKYEGASCLISACMGVPERMRPHVREISSLTCEPDQRGKGYATRLLQEICDDADTRRMVLVMTVEPYGDEPALTEAQLVEWYTTGFDFNHLQYEPLMLVRMFNPYPESKIAAKIGQIITEGCK